jgi:tetratricopeptide (TPR) repeat protein
LIDQSINSGLNFKKSNLLLKEYVVNSKWSILIAVVFLLTIIFTASTYITAQESANCPPDKELCTRMIRFGNEAYARGKYLDAKEYFRKAIKADPTSLKAWRYYDQAIIFALAEKVEKNANLVLPDVSSRQEASGGLSPKAPPVPPKPAMGEQENSGFKILDDEGC